MKTFEDVINEALKRADRLAHLQSNEKSVPVYQNIEGWSLQDVLEEVGSGGASYKKVQFTMGDDGDGPLMIYETLVRRSPEELRLGWRRRFDRYAPEKVHEGLTREGYSLVDDWERVKDDNLAVTASSIYLAGEVELIINACRKIYKKEECDGQV